MKSIKDTFSDTKPKTVAKITKAFEKGNCVGYMDQFKGELMLPSAQDFPEIKCVVTDSFICSYNLFMSAFTNEITIIPINQVANLYRSNIDIENNYDYDTFHLTLELKDGWKRYIGNYARNLKNSMNVYDGILTCVRGRINIM